jgi:SAM-dependent methyltransferase
MIAQAYRKIVPVRIRRSRVVRRLKWTFLGGRLGHDLIYDADYYERTVAGPAAESAQTIAASIVSGFAPKVVFDVGCGTGALLAALARQGCTVFGVEYSKAALAYCHGLGLDVTRFDIENDPYDDSRRFDVAVSIEVAEHLPDPSADRYVDLLARADRAVVFTAATPGQGGNDHVNEQPPEYWVAKFRVRGFHLDEGLTNAWRDRWSRSGCVREWYYRNLMVFRRAGDGNRTR